MVKFMMTVSDEMHQFLLNEMKKRKLDTIQETLRQIITEKTKNT